MPALARIDAMSARAVSGTSFSARDTIASPNRSGNPTVEFARCFLSLANLPNFALDCLRRYEVTLSRQAGRIVFAFNTLDRPKPQERGALEDKYPPFV